MTHLPFRIAAAAYRRALAAVADALPAGRADDAVAVFEALQRDAYRTRGWSGVVRYWLAETASLARLRATAAPPGSPGHRRPSGGRVASTRYDLRDAWRSLRRAPAYSLLVILMLALGIGANTAIFSVVDALLFKSLPYVNADRLVLVAEWPRTGGNWTVAPTAYQAWRQTARSFTQLEARQSQNITVLDGGDPEEVRGARVSPGYFDLLGVTAALGRGLTAADATPGAPCVAVVSHSVWVRRLGGSPAAVGQAAHFGGQSCVVVGVLPAASVFDRGAPEIYVPLVFSPPEARSEGRALTVIGRLKDGVTVEQAGREIAAVAEAFNQTRGSAGRNWTAMVMPWRDFIVRTDARQLVWVLFGAVALVLVIACANVAGLALSRTIGRRREIAVRAALGAGRLRLFRALVVESLLLAGAGGVIALALGTATLRALVVLMPPGTLPAEAAPTLDARALAFTMAVCALTAVLAAILPAWQAGRVTLTEALSASGRGFSTGRRTAWLQSALLVAEIALAMVLVTGATLLTVSFIKLTGVWPGFDASHVLTFRLSPPTARYGTDEQIQQYFARVRAAIDALPTVETAGAVTSLPLNGWLYGTRFTVDGVPSDPDRPTAAHMQHVTPGYFEALRIGLAAGRTFTDRDDATSARVVIVNQTFATRFVPDGRAIGRTLRMDTQPAGQPEPAWEIVGVIRDVKTGGLADPALRTPEIYVPHAQIPLPVMWFAVRARGEAAGIVPDVRAAVRSVDAEVPIGSVMPMDERLGLSLRVQRFRTATIGVFAGLAALLACLGTYAVRSRAVAARTRELGIRAALGATRRQVIGVALAQGVRLAAVGLALGWVASYLLAGLVRDWLFETRATDPLIAASAVALLGGAAAAASWIPARRAAAVDPLAVLRED